MVLMQLLLFSQAAALLVGTCSSSRLDALPLGCLLLCMGPTSLRAAQLCLQDCSIASCFDAVQQHSAQGSCSTPLATLLISCVQSELGLVDRVAFSSKFNYNSCLQAIYGEQW
jgi:hypothetical protein